MSIKLDYKGPFFSWYLNLDLSLNKARRTVSCELMISVKLIFG